MNIDQNLIQRRTDIALKAIFKAYGKKEDEFGATLFVSHHLSEISGEYWEKHLGTRKPKNRSILKILELRSHWGEDEDDGIDYFDFSLPGDATDYVISVRFNAVGRVAEISMES